MKIFVCFAVLALLVALVIALGTAGYGPAMNAMFNWLCIIIASLFLYFLPAFIAWNRGHINLMAIFWTNFFLGWTFLGWVAALIWSCMNTVRVKPVLDTRWANLHS
jgi:hypothetical protein